MTEEMYKNCGYRFKGNSCKECPLGCKGKVDEFQRLKQDNEAYKQSEQEAKEIIAELKHKINKQWELLEQCGVHAGGELQRVNYIIKELQKENEKLKTTIYRLESKEDAMCNCNKELNEDVKVYRKALEEIKEIAMGIMDDDIDEGSAYYDADQIITKINEVLSEKSEA